MKHEEDKNDVGLGYTTICFNHSAISILPLHDSYTCFTNFVDVHKIWTYSGCKEWKVWQLSTTLFITYLMLLYELIVTECCILLAIIPIFSVVPPTVQ